MNLVTKAALIAALGLVAGQALAQEKLKVGSAPDPVRSLGRARPASARRLQAGPEGHRRQAGRPRGRGHHRRRRVEARRGRRPRSRACWSATRSTSSSARSSPTSLVAIHKPIVDSKTFLISPNAGPSTSPARAAARTSSPPRTRTTRTMRCSASRAGPRLQARLPARAELSGRQGCARRLQAPLQGRGRRGILRSARTARLPVRARQDRLAEARRDLHLHAGRHGREPRQAVSRRPGLADRIPFLSAFTVDEVDAAGAAGCGASACFGGSNWAPNLDTPENKKFVAAFEAAYKRVPGSYAMHAYDAALLIDSAAEGDRRQDRRQGRAAAPPQEGGFQVAARRLQVRRQRLPDPGLLSGEGGEAAGRQVPDRDRREGVRRLRRCLCQGMRRQN